jgi:pyruvate dehydrogenase E1 component alpha subunit
MFDPDLYRDPDEVEQWKQRDPIVTFGERLLDAGDVTSDEIDEMWAAARAETEAAVEVADAAPLESIDTLLEHVTLEASENSTPRPDTPIVDDDEVWP